MAKLSTSQRKSLPSSDFALPGRRYPVEDKGHAQAARARVKEFGSPDEQQKVFSKTAKFFKGKKGKKKSMPFIGEGY